MTQHDRSRSITDLDHVEARSYLLQSKVYFREDLPIYFNFSNILSRTSDYILSQPAGSLKTREAKDHDNVNHYIYATKDGRGSWRPFQLIHPALYVDLVHCITESSTWKLCRAKLNRTPRAAPIRCASIPVISNNPRSDQGAQIREWQEEIERESIRTALDFEHAIHADIENCYPSIYTHSIAWALHGKAHIKSGGNRRNPSLPGNAIDTKLQDLHHGQTNGVPQGSVLIDIIAEILLTYADELLLDRISDYSQHIAILRYRDDYRIFFNERRLGDQALKDLSKVLDELGLRLSQNKTMFSTSAVTSSIKQDKMEWIRMPREDKDVFRMLLQIHGHAAKFPNGGSLFSALDSVVRSIERNESSEHRTNDPVSICSLAADIGIISPKHFPICATIISHIANTMPPKERAELARRLHARIRRVHNCAMLEIWTQRVTIPMRANFPYHEKLCHLAAGGSADLWNSAWISDTDLKDIIDPREAIDKEQLGNAPAIISRSEVRPFQYQESDFV